METIAITGNKSSKSDCEVILEKTDNSAVNLTVYSKVERLYGRSIRALAQSMLSFYSIKGVSVTIHDNGALDFVLAARLEAAIKKLFPVDAAFLLPVNRSLPARTGRRRHRVSRLYLPGNTPSLMINAGIHRPDGIIFDLEDSVAPEKKMEARYLVRNALRHLDFYGAERMVRINPYPMGLDDLAIIIPENPNLILLPKCERGMQITVVNHHINDLKSSHGINNEIWLIPIIESALGVINAFDIATEAPNIVGMAIGVEDYTADIGAQRSAEGIESLYARSAIVNACRAAGIQTSDSVYSDVMDTEGLKAYIQQSKQLGFDGMGCIHPRQIRWIHEGYAPTSEQITQAGAIVEAYQQAKAKGLGVVALGTKMVDMPVVKRAQNLLAAAQARGLLITERKENLK